MLLSCFKIHSQTYTNTNYNPVPLCMLSEQQEETFTKEIEMFTSKFEVSELNLCYIPVFYQKKQYSTITENLSVIIVIKQNKVFAEIYCHGPKATYSFDYKGFYGFTTVPFSTIDYPAMLIDENVLVKKLNKLRKIDKNIYENYVKCF